jgi:hypothetical protein
MGMGPMNAYVVVLFLLAITFSASTPPPASKLMKEEAEVLDLLLHDPFKCKFTG